ncbi:MAG: hypothetical protein AMJ72_02740 [Acidithiobacillales bacterium SM1_46]|nr:MAG: hypothetical protein AMJ72_02740 [Acidithiobacillales bacterium SM1_46]
MPQTNKFCLKLNNCLINLQATEKLRRNSMINFLKKFDQLLVLCNTKTLETMQLNLQSLLRGLALLAGPVFKLLTS